MLNGVSEGDKSIRPLTNGLPVIFWPIDRSLGMLATLSLQGALDE